MRWPWGKGPEPPSAHQFEELLDEVIADFRRDVANHERKLVALKEAVRDR